MSKDLDDFTNALRKCLIETDGFTWIDDLVGIKWTCIATKKELIETKKETKTTPEIKKDTDLVKWLKN